MPDFWVRCADRKDNRCVIQKGIILLNISRRIRGKEGPVMKQKEKQRLKISENEISGEKKRSNPLLISAVCILCSVLIGVGAGFAVTRGRNTNTSKGNVKIVVNAGATEEPKEENSQAEAEASEETAQQKLAAAFPKPAEENDLINIIAEAKRRGMTKRAYLTFDDGPSKKITPEILDILKRHDIKATFFEVGRLIDENPDVAKRVFGEGHLIANHSYSHDYNALYATEQSFSEDITKAEQTIEKITGEKPFRLIRFPGGSYNAGDHAAEKQVYKKTLANMGYYYCDWNTLNGDAEGKEKSPAELDSFFKKYAVSYIEQNKNLIVLMHDSDVKQATVDSLEGIIVYLAENGYTFHRLDDIEWNEAQ